MNQLLGAGLKSMPWASVLNAQTLNRTRVFHYISCINEAWSVVFTPVNGN